MLSKGIIPKGLLYTPYKSKDYNSARFVTYKMTGCQGKNWEDGIGSFNEPGRFYCVSYCLGMDTCCGRGGSRIRNPGPLINIAKVVLGKKQRYRKLAFSCW